MTRKSFEERLRQALADSGNGEAVSQAEIERLAELLGSGSAEDVAEKLDAWIAEGKPDEPLRLYPEIEQAIEESLNAAPRGARTGRSRLRPWLAAAAVLLLMAVGLPWLMREAERPPAQLRTGEAPAISTTIALGATLPREAFELRWEGAPKGSIYAVELATSELVAFHREMALEDETYTVPVEALQDLPAGSAVLWRVEATLPEGEQISSPTFRVRIE